MEFKTWKLAVRLVKEGYGIEQCISYEKVHAANLEQYKWPQVKDGVLIAGNAYSTSPKWRTLFTRTKLPQMNNRGAVCFMALTVKNRVLFVSFGPAQIYLNSEAFERDFGLKVTLNSVDKDKLVSIDAKTPQDQSIQKRVQASHQSDVTAFGINISQDLLKGVAGKPSNSNFASLLAGSDTLIIHTKVDETTIVSKCEEILAAYFNGSYKSKFPWVDNVRPVKDKPLIEELDQMLIEDLQDLFGLKDKNSIGDSQLYLAIPDIVDHEHSANYGFIGVGKSVANQEFPLPALSDYINLVDDEISIENLKGKHKIGQRTDGSEGFFEKWSVYKCLVCEVKKDDDIYILSEGDWYQVKDDYVTQINIFFDNLLASTDTTDLNFLPSALLSDNETTYIEKLKQNMPSQAVCLDQDEIKAADWNSSVEACDFYTVHKDFIHLKNETSSSTLSHLFMQGLVSAQVYKRSADFRKQLKEKVDKLNSSAGSTVTTNDPTTSDYRVVYAILRKPYRDGKFNLPFFSKVALKSISENLSDLNYKVGLFWIKKAN